ncbi:Rv3654c family TadE-like protein [Pedococcus dokdonensis]|uniref:Rv3654c family TadE-like protein n=1 Tax=Pedococcus dokdonensis TaxID=443156 RepID=UPI0012FD9C48
MTPSCERCRSGGRCGRERDCGSASVLAVAAVGLLLVVLVGGLALASAVVATHRARAAADLAALAAAQAVQQGLDPAASCHAGATVAARNGTRPAGCVVAPDGSVSYRVTTGASLVFPGTGGGSTTATARAGPSPRRGPALPTDTPSHCPSRSSRRCARRCVGRLLVRPARRGPAP